MMYIMLIHKRKGQTKNETEREKEWAHKGTEKKGEKDRGRQRDGG